MIVARQADRRTLLQHIERMDGTRRIFDRKTPAGKYPLVAQRVEVRKPVRKVELLAVDNEMSVRRHGIIVRRRAMGGVDAQKIPDAGTLQLQKAGRTLRRRMVQHHLLDRTEYPVQHVDKMDADIGRHAAALARVAFPRSGIPASSGSDVRKVYVINRRGGGSPSTIRFSRSISG